MNLIVVLGVLLVQLFTIPYDADEVILSIQDLPHYEDKDRSASFQEISHMPDGDFILKPNFQPINYNTSSAYWMNFSFTMPENDKKYLMEFYDQTIDSLEVYLYAPDGHLRHIVLGDSRPFNEKPFKHKNFEISLHEPGKYKCYVRVASRHYADIRLAIRSINHFVYYALNEYFLYGVFYGMILIISLYNSLIYLAIRELRNLYYTIYLLSVGLYAMCVDGIAYQYLWPGFPEWNQIAYGVALFLVIFWSIIFSKSFLNTKIRAPRVDKVLNVVLALRIAYFFYCLFFNQDLFQYRNIEIIPLSVVFYSSIVVLLRGYRPARFFVVAYGVLFLGFIVKALLMVSGLPFLIPKSYYSLHFAFVFEMLFLAFALSDRVRILKANRDLAFKRTMAQHKENMKLKEKVNRELEDKIAQRTIEIAGKNRQLEEQNLKLQNQSQEIERFNALLDLDNWKLRNDIKTIQKERVMNKQLTYEEFADIFKVGHVCMKFLSKHKWEQGYECLKCSNKKHFSGQGVLSRRCTRCGYNETPTTNTIFHGCKFPIEKAFYILYTVLNKDESSLAVLADKLDLRRNTILNFKKKIQKLMEENPSELKNFFQDLQTQQV